MDSSSAWRFFDEEVFGVEVAFPFDEPEVEGVTTDDFFPLDPEVEGLSADFRIFFAPEAGDFLRLTDPDGDGLEPEERFEPKTVTLDPDFEAFEPDDGEAFETDELSLDEEDFLALSAVGESPTIGKED